MRFDKEVKFIGLGGPDAMSDGSQLYKVTLYDVESGSSVVVNLMDTDANKPLLEALDLCDFGDVLKATFEIKPKDKLYRLRLIRV